MPERLYLLLIEILVAQQAEIGCLRIKPNGIDSS